ncbi:hypothetical protein JOM56_004844 [Amanita muscaria]
MATNPVVRASTVSSGRYSGLTVDSLEDTITPSTPAPSALNNLATYDLTNTWSSVTPFSYTSKCLKTIFKKNVSDFDRAQALYQVFIEIASELETTSHFTAVMTRIADNLESLGCKKKPCTQHCDRSHCEPCTLEHAQPCMIPHAEPCTLEHAQPCMLSHADPCTLPHFFVTPQTCTLSHADPCNLLHIDPCTLSHAEPCTLSHDEPCTLAHNEPCNLNHFPVEPVTVAVTIPCPLAHNDVCTKEHCTSSPTPTSLDLSKKRKRFKHKKTIGKLTRAHENDVLCRSQNNSDYDMDSDGFCRDPLTKQYLNRAKKEFYEEDDKNFVDTMRNFMNLADDSDFLADKKPSKNGPGFFIVPVESQPPPTRISPLPLPSLTTPLPPPKTSAASNIVPSASTSALPLETRVPPLSRPQTPSLTPKVSLPRAQTEPLPPKRDTTTLPQRAQTAPPNISRNTITARRCTNNEASPSSFVKFMDIPVTMTREHINDCLKDNRKWSAVDISNMEIFAIKNKDLTVVNVLKIKFKDDIQSTTKMPTVVSLYEIKLMHTPSNITQQHRPNIDKHRITTSYNIDQHRPTTSRQQR